MNNKPEWIKRFGEKFTIGVEIDNDNSYKQVAYQNTNGACSFLQESDLLDFISKEISKAEQAMNKRCNEECEKRIIEEADRAKKQGYKDGYKDGYAHKIANDVYPELTNKDNEHTYQDIKDDELLPKGSTVNPLTNTKDE